MENLNLVLPEIFISLSIMFLIILVVFKKDANFDRFAIKIFMLWNCNDVKIIQNVFVDFSSNLFNSRSSSLVSSRYFPIGTSKLIFMILTRFNDCTL